MKVRKSTGKMERWSLRRGWEIGPTRFEYHIEGIHMFQRLRFKGLRVREDHQFARDATRRRPRVLR
jgi:hypothetical protein